MYTQTQIEELESAIASGILTVKSGTQEVTYQSTAAMVAALERMRSDVNQSGIGRSVVAEFCRD